MPNELKMQTTWGRDPLPAAGDGQIAYLLVELTADAEQMVAGPVPALNLALVLDHSGSMSGPKIQHLKEAVTRMIDQLGPDDTLSITVFDERAKLLVAGQKVTDRAALQAQVAGLREAGGTQMSSGLRMGLDEVRRAAGPGVVSRLLLLTDGQTWGDAEECVKLAGEAGTAGVPISAFGVGADEDWSVSLLDRIGQASGGSDDYIAQPAEMLASFRKTVQTMQATAVQRTTLLLQLAAGVDARNVYRITPMITKLSNVQADANHAVTINLGDIGRDSPATLLVELTVPPRRPGQYRLARAVAHYALPGSGGTGETGQDLLMNFVAGLPASPGNSRVMNLVEKATAFRLQTRALQEAEVGNIPAATRTLRSAATRLLNLGEADLAQQAEQEAQRLEHGQQMSTAGTKKLTFATRKLSSEDAGPGAAPPTASPPPAAATPEPSTPITPTAGEEMASSPPETSSPPDSAAPVLADEGATQRYMPGEDVAARLPTAGAPPVAPASEGLPDAANHPSSSPAQDG